MLLAVPALLLAGALGWLLVWPLMRAQRSLEGARRSAASAGLIRFSLRPLDSSGAGSPGFEPVAAQPSFTCGMFFGGDLYLAEPAGLSIYSPAGELRGTLRTGMELPVAPIVAMASGRLRGAAEPQLLLATSGAGLLIVSQGTAGTQVHPGVQQLLPGAAEARDLTALLPLATGDLLLGTRHGGALLFDGVALSPVRFNIAGVEASRVEVTALAAAGSAAYLIGTRNSGVVVLRAGVAQQVDAAAGLPDTTVESITTANDRAFVATPRGVAELDLAGPQPRTVRTLAPGVFSQALALEPGALLVGSLGQGMRELRLDTVADGRPHLRLANLSQPASAGTNGTVSQFLPRPDPASPLFAIVDGTLQVRSSSGWTSALASGRSAAALTDRNISALAFDAAGQLYVGYFDRGLDLLPATSDAPVRHLEDDHLFCINRLVLDPERGTMAAATANGLVLFDRAGEPRQVLTRRDGVIADHVTDIAFMHGETVLATPAGLTFLTPAGAESLYAFQGLVNNHVYALAAAFEGDRLLAGTLGGLSLIQGGSVRRSFTASNSGLRHNWITALATQSDGSTLVGTYGAGVLRFTTESDGSTRFAPVDLPAGTPHDLVINPNAIFATPSHVYAGTLGHGMLVYSQATGRWASVTQGLPSLNVTAFAEREGALYIGTENGLVRIAEGRLP